MDKHHSLKNKHLRKRHNNFQRSIDTCRIGSMNIRKHFWMSMLPNKPQLLPNRLGQLSKVPLLRSNSKITIGPQRTLILLPSRYLIIRSHQFTLFSYLLQPLHKINYYLAISKFIQLYTCIP